MVIFWIESVLSSAMKTSDFNYDLPRELIAQHPAERREDARMLVVNRATGIFEHRCVQDLPEYLERGDLLVVNNTRVIPARLYGRKILTGGKVEFLLLEEVEPNVWDVLMRCSRRPAVGARIALGTDSDSATAVLLHDGEMGRARIRIESSQPFLEFLEREGVTPLPPYIARERTPAASDPADRKRYQTVYARHAGAVAAPTAGLHFTEEILGNLAERGVERTALTLHVGIGTFRPVEVDVVEEHRMDEERYIVSEETAAKVNAARKEGRRIMAVGSTTVRTLETVATGVGIVAGNGRSGIFIYPPYEFQVVDCMLTNFHLPCSTLLMMISALAGRDLVMRAYAEAVSRRYRFYSYGDCMLIL